MKYLKFMPVAAIDDASRNKRELAVAKEYGYDCYCYCDQSEGAIPELYPDFKLIVSGCKRPLEEKNAVKRFLINFRNVFIYIKELKPIKADIISCHNIVSLAVAYFTYAFRKNKPKFIYDSHEFELKKKPRNIIIYSFIKSLEFFLLKKSSLTIMINDGIADEVAKIHKLDYPRVVVRSTPDYWNIDSSVSDEMHREFCDKLGVSGDSFIIMYHGKLCRYRGIEEICKAMSMVPDIYLVTVGDYANSRYKTAFESMVNQYQISSRILQYPAQPLCELWKYVSAADCGIVMNNTDNPNYIYALPNKFFENIQSMAPIICSDSVEMARIIRQYDIGILSPSGDAEKLAENIEKMRTDKELYRKFKFNLVKAKDELCWEKEKEKLKAAFAKYL
ncbi:MAG: glycosyltransferase [Eubacteriales bacterium]|nr:glycosyltransferase [Eubacteriales bacterium]